MPISYAKIKARKEIDPEYAAKQKGYSVAYKERNLEKERARQRLVKAKKRTENREAYNTYMREWTQKNKDRLNTERRDKLQNNLEYAAKIRAIDRKRHKDNPDRTRNQNIKTIYGITLDDYHKMYENQSGKCAICNDEKPDYGKNGLVIDHCHNKGHIRELLCSKCNKGLGHFNDDVNRLTNAMEYLIKHTKE